MDTLKNQFFASKITEKLGHFLDVLVLLGAVNFADVKTVDDFALHLKYSDEVDVVSDELVRSRLSFWISSISPNPTLEDLCIWVEELLPEDLDVFLNAGRADTLARLMAALYVTTPRSIQSQEIN